MPYPSQDQSNDPNASHQMPDGMMMKNSDMQASTGVMLPMGDMPLSPDTDQQQGSGSPEDDIEAVKRQKIRDDEEIILTRKNVQQLRRQVMVDLFEDLRKLGVDPQNPESVHEFTSRLEQFDPDLAALFAASFEALLPDQHELEMDQMLGTQMRQSQETPQELSPEMMPEETAPEEIPPMADEGAIPGGEGVGNYPQPAGGIPESPEEIE